jgi:histidine triad (HIT) family protein
MTCVFCQIISGEIATEVLHQDEEVVAFRDIEPRAPIHILILPRKHIPSLTDVEDEALIGRMVKVAKELAEQEGISGTGYRLVINHGRDGGQVISHLHMHLLGGRHLSARMG